MQYKFINLLKAMLVMLTAGIVVASCNKQFDQPPGFIEPNITPNTTIRQLKAMHIIGAFEQITTDIIIGGVVVADDKSGNFYKSIAIQDETGGITVRLDGNNLYTSYPVGRKIYIKLKGLYLGDYNRLIQIGGGIDDTNPTQPDLTPISTTLFDKYVIKGSSNNAVTPKVVTVAQLHDSLQSMLIQLNGMEFIASDTNKTYADAVTNSSRNLNVKGCGGSSVILRTSGFANFAGVNVPNGNGTLIAVYTMFGSTKQLIIRDTSDVRFTGPRCGSGPTTIMNISALRGMFSGTSTSAPADKRITGIVISDRTTNNINSQNIVLQQATDSAGILIRFDAPHTFNLGDSLEVNVSGQELSEFNSLLQLNNVPVSFATRISTGKTIIPRVATVAQINTNFEAWESTLVKINTAALSGGSGGNYSGSVTVNDGSGTITMFTNSSATFASQAYPPNAASVTGYLSQFGANKELRINSPSNVVAGTGGGGSNGLALGTSPFLLNFDNIASGYPQGVSVKIGATASSLGTGDAAIYNAGTGGLANGTPWAQFSAGVKNYASATGLTSASDSATQANSTNRALGFRQTSTNGDPGVAFTFQLNNTTGKSNFNMSFLLQSLDATVGRTVTWTVQYGIGDNPSNFTTVPTTPATLTTGPTFGSTSVTANFGTALNNVNQKVWIRIVTLTASTGSGNRPSTAIDDFQLTWN